MTDDPNTCAIQKELSKKKLRAKTLKKKIDGMWTDKQMHERREVQAELRTVTIDISALENELSGLADWARESRAKDHVERMVGDNGEKVDLIDVKTPEGQEKARKAMLKRDFGI